MKGLSEAWQCLLRKKIGKDAEGREYDLDGTADLCRVLRPPGTVNHKYGCLVTSAVFEPNRRYDWRDFEQYIEPEAKKAQPLPHAQGSDDRAGKALAAMLRIGIADGNDGSKRLYTSACRAVEWDLSDDEALTTIRAYAAVRPFPWDWNDKQVLERVRSAERAVNRGESLRQPTRGREVKPDEPIRLRRITAVPLLRGNDPTVKGFILEQLAKQTIQVAQAIGLVNRLDELALWRARAVSGGGGTLRCKVSAKSAVSIYGLQRMPVTLYAEQWERLLAFGDELKAFISAQNGSLSRKRAQVAA